VDPIYDFAEHLQHVRQQLTGAAPPGIPTNYLQQPEDGRPYWSGPASRSSGSLSSPLGRRVC
jgi:hypothetical protein